MTEKQLQQFIATDQYGLLRDGENKVIYWLKRIYYKLLHKVEELHFHFPNGQGLEGFNI